MTNKSMAAKRIAILDAYTVDGPVYAVRGTEWPDQTSSNTYVVAIDLDGNEYTHRTFSVAGHYVSESDGWNVVTPRWSAEAEAAKFIARVMAVRSIDPALWSKVPPPADGPLPQYWDEDEIAAGRGLVVRQRATPQERA